MESTVNWQQLIVDLKGSVERIDERTKLEFEKIDTQFEKVSNRFEKIDARFEKVDARFDRVEGSITSLRENTPTKTWIMTAAGVIITVLSIFIAAVSVLVPFFWQSIQ